MWFQHETATNTKGRIARASDWAFDGLLEAYRRALEVTLRMQALTLLVALATVVLTAWLYIVIPKGFLPAQDTGLIQIATEAPGRSPEEVERFITIPLEIGIRHLVDVTRGHERQVLEERVVRCGSATSRRAAART